MLNSGVWHRLAALGHGLPESLPVVRAKPETSVAGLSEADAAAAKRACGVVAGAVGFAVLPPVAAAAAALPLYYAATALPELALRASREKTSREIDWELPRLAELMAVMTTAGLSPALALPRAAEDCAGPLRSSLDTALAAIELGIPRRQALARAAAATPSRDYVRFVELLADAERFGQPLGGPLRAMAGSLRDKQAAAVRDAAQKLPIKMLFPLVFLILPAFILLSAGPLIVTMVK